MRFEHVDEPLASRRKFLTRLGRATFLAAVLVTTMLGIGMGGYALFEGMGAVDAFANAAMILSGMGPLGPLSTTGGKIFAGCYALASGLIFTAALALVLAPILHRWLHAFHMEGGGRR
jgi:hypothetical protein